MASPPPHFLGAAMPYPLHAIHAHLRIEGGKGADYNISGNDDTGSLALIVMMALGSATSTTLSMRGHLAGKLKGIVPFLKGN